MSMEDGLMKADGVAARPWSQFSQRAKSFILGGVVVAALIVVSGTTVLVRSRLGKNNNRNRSGIGCGETRGSVAVSQNYGENYPDTYPYLLLDCWGHANNNGATTTTSTTTKTSKGPTILMFDDLWGTDAHFSSGKSWSGSETSASGLVGYGLVTDNDQNVAYHYTYTIGDGYGGGDEGTVQLAFNNGMTYSVSQDTVWLITTPRYSEDGLVQIQELDVDLSEVVNTGESGLLDLVQENADVANFLAQTMANFMEYEQQQAQDEGN